MDSTGTVGNILKGGTLFLHNFGSDNTFLGKNAGNLSTSGAGRNTAIGSSALNSNGSGDNNTASGFDALASNTGGSFNTADGAGALLYNTDGSENTAAGALALYSNATGSANTASGRRALHSNTTGGFNTAIGADALFSNTTGASNTAIGDLALRSNTIGGSNVAIGDGTLFNNVVDYNTAIGFGADVIPAGLTNATAIGAYAVVSASNAMVLGNVIPGVNVGIGVSAPAFKLHVIDRFNTGLRVEDNMPGGTVASFGGYGEFQVDAPNIPGGRLIIKEAGGAGLVGINTNAPDATLSVNGTADKPGAGSWGIFSDARLKTVHGAFAAGLEQIVQLHPIRYCYKQENALGIHDADEHVGLVAQDVERVIPEAVSRNSQGYLILNNDPILWSMLNAIQQQQEQIAQLKQRNELAAQQQAQLKQQQQQIAELQTQLATSWTRLEKLERSIATLAVKAE
jgi:hypothetical protein